MDELDRRLVARALAGERTAFDLLVVRYQRRIAALISRYRLDAATIEDLTQDAFLKAYRGLAGFRGDSTFFTWLARIAINTAKTHLSERGRRPEVASLDDDAEIDPLAAIASGDSTEGAVVSRQMGEIIARAMDEMSPDLREALVMREVDGRSYQEIGAALGIPLNTVRSRIFRAREFVAMKLRPLTDVSRSKRW
ncbi:MAG: sigma-70 family RNA polymerase sigma factor [Burkholderiales bacterium]|nr:sigma-70 family RNA polymerase sigma factor [Burkholderiales bacterium]